MRKLIKYIKPFIKEESGQSLIEYAILAALLVVVVIAIVRSVGTKMKNKFNEINNAL